MAESAQPVHPGSASAGLLAPPPPEPPRVEPKKQHDYRVQTCDILEYILIPAFGLATGIVDGSAHPNPNALIGPSYDSLHPLKAQEILRINKSYKDKDTVPAWVPGAAWGVLALGLAGVWIYDGYTSDWTERRGLNALVVGYAEALVGALFLTETGKIIVGRLRPDFLGRLQRYNDCVSKNGEGTCDSERKSALDEGRLSFPSGHTSMSFAVANYAALAIGGRFVWGDKRTPASMWLGAGAQATLLGLATWVGVTRVDDHRHTPEDVMAGMLVGLALSNVAYWRRFDGHGRPRRAVQGNIDVAPGPGDAGVALKVRF